MSTNNGIAQHTTTGSLAERTLLVSLNISVWGATKKDRDATNEVIDANQATQEAGYFIKKLLPTEAMRDVKNTASAARAKHRYHTLPWSDKGQRVLPVANLFEYTEHMRKVKSDFEASVKTFLARYPSYMEAAKQSGRLGQLFDQNDYPTVEQVRTCFAFRTRMLPLPTAGDFRVQMDKEHADIIRQEIADRVAGEFASANKAIVTRLVETVTDMRERLARYKVDARGAVTGAFRNSVVTNLEELVPLLHRLNVTGDHEVTDLLKRAEKDLLAFDPSTLRDNDTVRATTIDRADELIKDLTGFFGQPA